MFDKLKKAFSNVVSDISKKEISEKDLENNLFDLELELLESDVAQEVIDDISKNLKSKLLGLEIKKEQTVQEVIQSNVKSSIYEIISRSGKLDLLKKIEDSKLKKEGPFIILFLGINGTGKTTTVAKVGNLIRNNGFSVVLAAGDTHRAGAIEQLDEHANRLSLKLIHQRYGADPSAVARDAVEYAKKHRIDAVLIDTAGRMQTAKNLMAEIGKIVNVIKPNLKIFVGDSLAGNDAIYQAQEFFEYTNFDGAILTKTDADAKGGAIISISHLTSKPIIFLGVGQGYDDIITFDLNKFVESIFNSSISLIDKKNYVVPNKIESILEKDTTLVHDKNEITNNLDNLENTVLEHEKIPTYTGDESKQETKSIVEKEYHNKEEDYLKNKNNLDIIKDNQEVKLSSETPNKLENNSSENNKKKSFFSSLFGKRGKKKKEMSDNEDDKLTNKDNQTEKSLDSISNDDNNSNNKKQKNKNDVVYLSDEDIDELLKE
ncbi:MAG: signal recognition particle-docking protein FtsY [Nitrososphaeraceae archaeon]